MICRMWLEIAPVDFSSFAGMLSGPGALDVFSWFIIFRIPSAFMVMDGIWGKLYPEAKGILPDGSLVKTEEK